MRGVGLVGQQGSPDMLKKATGDVEMATRSVVDGIVQPISDAAIPSHNASVTTLTENVEDLDAKTKGKATQDQ